METKNSWFVYVLMLIVIVNEYAVITEAKRGGGVFRSGAGIFSGRRVDTKGPKPSNNHGGFRNRPFPGTGNGNVGHLPSAGVGTIGRRSGSFGSVGRSAATGALAGLAAGYIGTRIGHHLAGGWHSGRYYHFGDRYYHGPGPHRIRCTIVTPNDFSMKYEDGNRVKEIIYECDRYREICCADGCCYRH